MNIAWAATTNLSLESYALKTTPVVTFGYVAQLFFSLLIVIGLVYITTKFILPKLQVSTKGRLIEVVERVGLEPGVSAYIVRIKDTAWLMTVSNKQVTKIGKLEDAKLL